MACVSKAELIKLQKTLKTDAAIGKKFGVSRQAIHQFRRKYGIEVSTAKTKERQDRDDKILNLFDKGMTGSKIAKMVGLSISQVYKIIKKNA